jgi:ABC-type uncharacterized transport system auxiliary subunit
LPSALLRRYFVLLLSDSVGFKGERDSSNSDAYALNLEIVRFECDLKKGVADVAVLCDVNNSRTSKTVFRCMIEGQSEIRSKTAGECARAMSSAVSDIANRLITKLNAANFHSGSKE